VVWRTSRSLAGDYEILSHALDESWKNCVVQQNTDFIAFDASALNKQPIGLQSNLVRRAIECLRPEGLDVGYAVLDRCAKFIADAQQRARVNLPGDLHMLREGMLIYVVAGDATLPIERWPQMPDDGHTIALKVPGSVTLSGGWKLSCERWNIASLAMEQAKSNDDPFQVWLDSKGISDALELRVRQDGDRFEPLGMDGHEMKISDFFINVKLPQRARDRWPLLCMGEKVVWVPGYRPAHPFRLTESTRQALYFSMTRS
jgi:tRNA(Ile)-lysidine synthase